MLQYAGGICEVVTNEDTPPFSSHRLRASGLNKVNCINHVSRWTGALAIAGATGFVVIVIILHLLQPDYQPVNQLMSELALGKHGGAMLVAFFSIAASTFSIALGIAKSPGSPWLRAALTVASLGFLGAGVFPLGETGTLHISFIAMAFVATVLAMYLFPSVIKNRTDSRNKWVSWCLACGTVVGVLLGQTVLPIGVGQRLAGACVVAWLYFTGMRLYNS